MKLGELVKRSQLEPKVVKETLFDEKLRILVDTYETFQKERIRANNRILMIAKGRDNADEIRGEFLTLLCEMGNIERKIAKDIEAHLKNNPVYADFLKHIKGVGPLLSARLMALPLRLGEHLSSWNAYFGLTPYYWKAVCENGHKILYSKEVGTCRVCGGAIVKLEKVEGAPRRVAGYQTFWNPYARKTAFLIGKQFIKLGTRGYYGRVYRNAKQRYSAKCPNEKPFLIDARAVRSAVKLFIAHFHQAVHDIYGIPVSKPYAFEYLAHEDFISWREVVRIEKAYME